MAGIFKRVGAAVHSSYIRLSLSSPADRQIKGDGRKSVKSHFWRDVWIQYNIRIVPRCR